MENDNSTSNNPRDGNVYAAPTSAPALKTQKKGFRFVEIVIVLGIVGILFGMLIPNVRSVRPAARRVHCLNNMRQISLAMINYESANGHFPPAYTVDENGNPMHSWRVLILPFIEEQALYDRIDLDEPWDGPNNSKLHDEVCHVFNCPASSGGQHRCDYVLVTGPGTGFDADNTISFGDIADGSSNSILLVETFDPVEHWMKPQDISLEQLLTPDLEKRNTNHPGARNVAFFDGSTHAIETDTPPEKLRKLILIDDGEEVSIYD